MADTNKLITGTSLSDYLTMKDIIALTKSSRSTIAKRVTVGAISELDYTTCIISGTVTYVYLKSFLAPKISKHFGLSEHVVSNAKSELIESVSSSEPKSVSDVSDSTESLHNHIESLKAQIIMQSTIIDKLLQQKDRDQVLFQNYQSQVSKATGTANLDSDSHAESVSNPSDQSNHKVKKKPLFWGWFG